MSESAVVSGNPALTQAYPVADDRSAENVAFSGLYATTLPRVYAFVRAQVGDVDTAQELVSRVFLKAYVHRQKAPEGEKAAVWLFRIAHNTVIDHWRVGGRRANASIRLEELGNLHDTAANPEQQYALKERQAILLRAMRLLPQEEQLLLSWKFAAQRTNREIADILSVSEGAVSMRLLRALRRLRGRLRDVGLP